MSSDLRVFNMAEAILWLGVAVFVAVRYIRRPVSRLEIIYAAAFACFGASDIFEPLGWWHLPWMVTWKVGNFLLLLVLAIKIEPMRARSDGTSSYGAKVELVVAKSWHKWSNWTKSRFDLQCLSDEHQTVYTCSYDKYLGFRVSCGDTVVVESTPRRKPRGWVWLSRPREFVLSIEGRPRGEIRRSALYAFTQDRLMLDGREYRIPDRLRQKVTGLGIGLGWTWDHRPRVTVADDENLYAAIAVLCFVMIRWLVVEG